MLLSDQPTNKPSFINLIAICLMVKTSQNSRKKYKKWFDHLKSPSLGDLSWVFSCFLMFFHPNPQVLVELPWLHRATEDPTKAAATGTGAAGAGAGVAGAPPCARGLYP